MKFQNRIFSFAAVCAAILAIAVATPASAQEISEGHMKAARDTVAAINATDSFDGILPQAAAALQASLIQKNPDLQELITSTVSAKALELAARRADLEREAAIAYAKVFSEEDLQTIATFYNSAAGKKLLESGPIVTRELIRAAEIWQNGIARDLSLEVGEALQSAAGAQVQQPAEGTETSEPESGN
ncbi:DUF2059 domain-containing protein [Aquamicrobium segne]|uniref:DUF2059 domain-containing protein n=1 Tax=Aquamicrobium segne TaxID=469547 RepID=A0ABW0GZ66_9HYPH